MSSSQYTATLITKQHSNIQDVSKMQAGCKQDAEQRTANEERHQAGRKVHPLGAACAA
jgi:hypothetical protein